MARQKRDLRLALDSIELTALRGSMRARRLGVCLREGGIGESLMYYKLLSSDTRW